MTEVFKCLILVGKGNTLHSLITLNLIHYLLHIFLRCIVRNECSNRYLVFY